MPNATGLVEEGGALECRGRNTDDIRGEEEEVSGDLTELSVLFGGFDAAGGEGVGEIDAGIPESVAEFPDAETN